MSGGNNASELKSIFNLFDPDSTGEVDIKQINQIFKQIDTLSNRRDSPSSSPTNRAHANKTSILAKKASQSENTVDADKVRSRSL